jgi:ABC-type Na+ efflux pump permease subunit
MQTIKAVFTYTFYEHVRHKVWLSGALFGLVMLMGGVVASALAQDERARMMMDLGLAASELIALVSVVFLTVHLILQEIESRSVYLILTHPVKRWHYLLGRFMGTLAAVGLGLAAMGLVHWSVLAASSARFTAASSVSSENSARSTSFGTPPVTTSQNSGMKLSPSEMIPPPSLFAICGKNRIARVKVWSSYDSKLSGLCART